MLLKVLKAKWIVGLMAVVCLLPAIGMANASYWCLKDNSCHLKTNLAGQCWTDCSSAPASLQRSLKAPRTTGLSAVPWADCLDAPVQGSVLAGAQRTPLLNKTGAELFDPFASLRLADQTRPDTGFVGDSLSARLPAYQTRASLRTVILLQ